MKNGGWSGFVVLRNYVKNAAESVEWRNHWNATITQEECYRALIRDNKYIYAVKQYREDHNRCFLKDAKNAIDELRELVRLENTLAP